jgi:hypothetical protein
MNRFKKLLAALAVTLGLAVPALVLAGDTQVGSSTFRASAPTGAFSKRSDGVFQEVNTGAPYILENAQPGSPGAFGYLESFTPGAYAAVPSALTTIAGVTWSAAAQQLDIGYFGPHAFIFGQGTAQTILPVMDANGLDISGDQVAAESYEMFAGTLGASGRPAVIGVDPAFYFCATVKIADVSGASKMLVGWRSATQTQTATITTYLNYATIGTNGTANPNTVFVMTGNDDTDVSTDTTNTVADGESHVYCVGVGAAGAAYTSLDGVSPTATMPAFSFDDGDSVIPFITLTQGSDLTEAVDILEWRVGYCRNDGLSGLAERVCDASR